MTLRVVVTGGGTGGHIYPALAVAEALRADSAVEDLLYIGKTDSLESEMIPAQDFAFQGISFSGMPRGKNPLLPFKLMEWLVDLQLAIGRAKKLLQDFRPDVVLGTGGYVSAPVLMAAKALKIPYLVHEPDSHPGLVNQLMARNAAIVTGAFAGAQSKLKTRGRFVLTGNPIRGDVGQLSKSDGLRRLELPWDEGKPVLVVVGGSQGARTLNQAVAEALPALLGELGLRVLHQSGKKLYEEAKEAVLPELRNHPDYCLRPYYSDMSAVWALGDVALCRSGSLTLSELYLSGTPSLLVPYPYAAADHQRKNAQASVDAGASLMLTDADCTGEALLARLRPLLSDAAQLATMRDSARALAHPEATARIVALLKEAAQGAARL